MNQGEYTASPSGTVRAARYHNWTPEQLASCFTPALTHRDAERLLRGEAEMDDEGHIVDL